MGQIGETGRPVQQSGMLDDDEEIIAARTKMSKKEAAPGAGIGETIKEAIKEAKRRMKGGHKMYTGERMIHINNQPLNDASKFCNNYVSTSKYNLVTFLPKFFIGELRRLLLVGLDSRYLSPAEQFSKYANVFFLFTACIQQIPNVSPTSRYTTILPLSLVLLVAAFKEMQEDLVSPRRLPLGD